MRISAAVLREAGLPRPYAESKPLELVSLRLDPPGPGDVLVRVRATGLCHSDLSTIDGTRTRPLPMVLGHEAAGVVLAVGSDVKHVDVGDHVVMTFVPSCGSCLWCQAGRPALCEPGAAANGAGVLLGGHRRLWDGDGPVHHHLGVSGFADHAVVSARSVVRVPPDLPFATAALFGCAVLTGVGAVVNAAKVRVGESVAIFGLGGVGLAALLGAHAAGAEPIVVVDRVDGKLRRAEDLGASHALTASDDVAAQIRELTHGGVHHAIETVGTPASRHATFPPSSRCTAPAVFRSTACSRTSSCLRT
jgi:alcohol dehydrogenase